MTDHQQTLYFADGRGAVLRASSHDFLDDVHEPEAFAETALIEDLLEATEAAFDAHCARFLPAITATSAANAKRLSAALDAIAPELTVVVERCAMARIDEKRAYWQPQHPLPSTLAQPEVFALAIQWLYWRTGANGRVLTMPDLAKFCSAKTLKEVIAAHPAVGRMPCPRCAREAGLTVSARLSTNQRGKAQVSCSHCGHTEAFGHHTRSERIFLWEESPIFSCECESCKARVHEIRQRIRAGMGMLQERLVTRIRRCVALARRSVARIDAEAGAKTSPALANQDFGRYRKVQTEYGTMLLLEMTGIFHESRPGVLSPSWWALKKVLPVAARMGTLKAEPLVELDSEESILDWYVSGRTQFDWNTVLAIPEGREEFKAWISYLRGSGIMGGDLDLPLALYVSISGAGQRAEDEKLAQQEEKERIAQEAADLRLRIAAATKLLHAHGFTVIPPRGRGF